LSRFVPWKVRYAARSVNTWRLLAEDRMRALRRQSEGAPRASRDGPKVSIAIPTLCAGAHEGRLESLRTLLAQYLPRQSHENYEAIVICDGRNERVEALAARIADPRIRVETTERTARWGQPQTRRGIQLARGEFFLRLNDDNRPYRHYLASLLSGFEDSVDISYARVLFGGEARNAYGDVLPRSFILPNDDAATLRHGNVDCMCYMVRTSLAKRHVADWSDAHAADWWFLNALLRAGARPRFVERIVGEKR
jgi:cellulose synthase/poly-beta-1,6-N-acetylglucosamine synthase-like glycosyltransferase